MAPRVDRQGGDHDDVELVGRGLGFAKRGLAEAEAVRLHRIGIGDEAERHGAPFGIDARVRHPHPALAQLRIERAQVDLVAVFDRPEQADATGAREGLERGETLGDARRSVGASRGRQGLAQSGACACGGSILTRVRAEQLFGGRGG